MYLRGRQDSPQILGGEARMRDLFSTRGAAKYLGLSAPAIRYHVYKSKRLHPEKIGGSLVFTQKELDRFQATKRPPGRPRKGEPK